MEQSSQAVEGPLERRVRRLDEQVESILQECAEFDPMLRIALNRRCELGPACERGPFTCDCGRKLK